MITQAQAELLRRVAEQGRDTVQPQDVAAQQIAASTLLALLDDLAAIRSVAARWQSRAVRAEAAAAALLDDLAAARARLAAAERVVRACTDARCCVSSFPNALMMDALDAYDALPAVPLASAPAPVRCPGCGMVHAP